MRNALFLAAGLAGCVAGDAPLEASFAETGNVEVRSTCDGEAGRWGWTVVAPELFGFNYEVLASVVCRAIKEDESPLWNIFNLNPKDADSCAKHVDGSGLLPQACLATEGDIVLPVQGGESPPELGDALLSTPIITSQCRFGGAMLSQPRYDAFGNQQRNVHRYDIQANDFGGYSIDLSTSTKGPVADTPYADRLMVPYASSSWFRPDSWCYSPDENMVHFLDFREDGDSVVWVQGYDAGFPDVPISEGVYVFFAK